MTLVARGSRSRCLAGDHGAALRSLRSAAESYAARGWPVLPGPVCDGLTSWDPVTLELLGGREPAASPSGATVDRCVISEWWSAHRQAILAPVGRHFDVLRTPTHLGWRMLAAFGGGRPLGPMALSPHGAYFFVEPGLRVDHDLAPGVEVLSPGDLVVLPPSRVVSGVVWWRISPVDQDALGDGDGILGKVAELSREFG
ncbi:bifunctional DNA primase/polymerase [Amycolatopsis sp. cg13]|uniref:bifunctional DNA primase/polymerase n=1 Tax=Amycolatopsis sp. cg13 TaxID=3238807 RepID=UPI003525FE13